MPINNPPPSLLRFSISLFLYLDKTSVALSASLSASPFNPPSSPDCAAPPDLHTQHPSMQPKQRGKRGDKISNDTLPERQTRISNRRSSRYVIREIEHSMHHTAFHVSCLIWDVLVENAAVSERKTTNATVKFQAVCDRTSTSLN